MDRGSLPPIEIVTNTGLEEANKSNPVKALKLEKRTGSPWLLVLILTHILRTDFVHTGSQANAYGRVLHNLYDLDPLCWLLGTSVHKNRRPGPYYRSPLLHCLLKEMLVPKNRQRAASVQCIRRWLSGQTGRKMASSPCPWKENRVANTITCNSLDRAS